VARCSLELRTFERVGLRATIRSMQRESLRLADKGDAAALRRHFEAMLPLIRRAGVEID
jgi:hypothetical protein